jgi:hypothetical protein
MLENFLKDKHDADRFIFQKIRKVMKKKLVTLLATALPVFAEDEYQEATSQVTSWKDSVMDYWNGLSDMHKMIIYGLVILAIVFVVYRTFKCGSCGGNCNCHK